MSSIGSSGEPFDQFDTDSQSVNTTGDTLSALFTNLAFTTGRGIMLQNRGTANVLLGKAVGTARWRILPGAVVTIYPKDLAKVAIKADSGTQTVDCLLVV